RELDKVKPKGKDVAVAIYEPIGLQGEVDQALLDEIKLWPQALRLYRSGDWDMAESQLINLSKAHSSRTLYKLFISRITALRTAPPEDGWDGSFRFETK
ncbi:MAG: adenylate/guanylate cyclase domain-containing protein, partial [Burkholderiales bacterium]